MSLEKWNNLTSGIRDITNGIIDKRIHFAMHGNYTYPLSRPLTDNEKRKLMNNEKAIKRCETEDLPNPDDLKKIKLTMIKVAGQFTLQELWDLKVDDELRNYILDPVRHRVAAYYADIFKKDYPGEDYYENDQYRYLCDPFYGFDDHVTDKMEEIYVKSIDDLSNFDDFRATQWHLIGMRGPPGPPGPPGPRGMMGIGGVPSSMNYEYPYTK